MNIFKIILIVIGTFKPIKKAKELSSFAFYYSSNYSNHSFAVEHSDNH